MNKYIRWYYKVINFLFLVLLSLFCRSQSQPYKYTTRVVYKLNKQTDSTDQKIIKEEFTVLLLGKEQSLFCAQTYLIIDSAYHREVSNGNTLGPSMSFFSSNRIENEEVIFKLNTQIITYDRLAKFIPTIFKYSEPKPLFTWIIFNDTLSIGGITCQKAETNFGNRKWTVWFAPSIPISDGPYKFNGLPGLILKANDEKQYWNFDLANISQIDTTIKIIFFNRIPQTLKDKSTFFARKAYSRDNRIQLMELDGYKFPNKEKTRKYFEEMAQKDNNWIELYKDDEQ